MAPRRSPWLFRAGLLLIVAGLAVLGYVGWQLYGTTWVSHKKQADGIESLQRGWADGESKVRTGDGVTGAIVRIPRFGKDYAVPVIEGTSDEALAAGLGHFTDTAGPGEVGNFALAGHRITHGEPLRGMPDLEVGDTVEVETRRAIFTYELTSAGDALTVPFTAGWVLDPVPANPDEGGVSAPRGQGRRLITLTTCSELFHTDDRLIAFGVLVDRQAKPR